MNVTLFFGITKIITIEDKLLFWKRWTENGIYYTQDILSENGNFLTFEEFKRRYNMSTIFLNVFQILASIPLNLKSKAASMLRPKNSVLIIQTFLFFH